jgi:hypothetical protein
MATAAQLIAELRRRGVSHAYWGESPEGFDRRGLTQSRYTFRKARPFARAHRSIASEHSPQTRRAALWEPAASTMEAMSSFHVGTAGMESGSKRPELPNPLESKVKNRAKDAKREMNPLNAGSPQMSSMAALPVAGITRSVGRCRRPSRRDMCLRPSWCGASVLRGAVCLDPTPALRRSPCLPVPAKGNAELRTLVVLET